VQEQGVADLDNRIVRSDPAVVLAAGLKFPSMLDPANRMLSVPLSLIKVVRNLANFLQRLNLALPQLRAEVR
jgi:hypothetical protein